MSVSLKHSGSVNWTEILPDGNSFEFWEKDCVYGAILHVNPGFRRGEVFQSKQRMEAETYVRIHRLRTV